MKVQYGIRDLNTGEFLDRIGTKCTPIWTKKITEVWLLDSIEEIQEQLSAFAFKGNSYEIITIIVP